MSLHHLSRVLLLFPILAAAAEPAPPASQPVLFEIAGRISPEAQRQTIEQLVGFGTRHTLSDTRSATRGIGAARRWVQSRFEAIARDCNGCLTVVTPSQTVSGERIPAPVAIVDVVAIQPGSSDPDRVIVISGHLDSRVSDVMNARSDAPGANDDGSGVAAVLETARVLSHYRFAATLVYAALSGEEQGLYGGKVLADYAQAQHWQVEADLNNDIIGNSHGGNGSIDNTVVRIFSEGTKSGESLDDAKYRRYHGGEVDSPSRNLARMMATLAERYLPDLRVRMVYRTDRYGRGGDQVPMLEAGFPAIRVTEGHEDYRHQHQDVRNEAGVRYGDTIDGIDFRYLTRVTALDALGMAQLASAPRPPGGVTIDGAVSYDTHIKWNAVPDAARYRVWWRDTTAPQWQYSRDVAGTDTELVLRDVVIDDWFFGVSAISADGFESPIVFPGAAGSF
ncbi:M28 family peptidase [Solimonas terrae]|uniref:M28 family peptidase n=1 Tax=Solimonas terrae TaxID=1396819 RepID=A0A6M2BVP5_9GAMM|nr:M28 family metallopeptidase [Solimonas terrae]NGY06325.1 M28 family peptidase [Solimonas terrae]